MAWPCAPDRYVDLTMTVDMFPTKRFFKRPRSTLPPPRNSDLLCFPLTSYICCMRSSPLLSKHEIIFPYLPFIEASSRNESPLVQLQSQKSTFESPSLGSFRPSDPQCINYYSPFCSKMSKADHKPQSEKKINRELKTRNSRGKTSSFRQIGSSFGGRKSSFGARSSSFRRRKSNLKIT